jgi:hypothetical protein
VKRSLILAAIATVLLFGSPVFTSATSNYEWVIQTGDRYDYSWTVENSAKTVVFQQNFYIIIDDLAEISESINPSDVWTLSETGFNVSMFWSNGTALDVSTVSQPFGFGLLPVGNWSQLIEAFHIEAGFVNDNTTFAYEYYDVVLGTGEHKEVKFQKSNGVLELYHMHEFLDSIVVFRLDIVLLSSTPVTATSTTPTDSTTTTTSPTPPSDPDPSMGFIIMTVSGSAAVLVIVMMVVKRQS